MVGDVVSHRETLNFFEDKPLFGKKILVTRSRDKSSKIVKHLNELGATVVSQPTIKIEKTNDHHLEDGIMHMNLYRGVVFTSAVAVTLFFEQLNQLGLDGRHLAGGVKIIAIGSETEKVINDFGIKVDIMPPVFTKEVLRDTLIEELREGDQLLIPRSAKGDLEWIDALAKDFNVKEVKCYDTLPLDSDRLLEMMNDKTFDFDYILFSSSSMVSGFVSQIDNRVKDIGASTKIVVIGPSTRQTALDLGLNVAMQPDKYTIASMIDCILQDVDPMNETKE